MPLIPALGRQRQVDFWVWGQPGLQSEFQDSQGYKRNSVLKIQNNNKKAQTNKQKNLSTKKTQAQMDSLVNFPVLQRSVNTSISETIFKNRKEHF
jgi:iron-sulfur cluster repair protein YtfE (RIC family)